MDPNGGVPKKSPLHVSQTARAYMAAAPVGAARKKHPGKAIMAGKCET